MTLAQAFDPRRNSLNAIRLVMAVLVVISHTWPVGAFGAEPHIGTATLGGLAVFVFFSLSGFLITRSRDRVVSTGVYLWHRFLRIYPALWGCLLIIAFVLAPISYAHHHGGLGGYSLAAAGRYVLDSASIVHRNDFNISGSLQGTPFYPLWDGPLYTLAWELGCYLVVAVIALLPGNRRRWITLAATALWLVAVVHKIAPGRETWDPRFTVFFAAGALLYVWADRVPLNRWLVAGAAVVTVAAMLVGGLVLIGALPLALVALWVGVRFPTRLGSRNDLSYGVYIYAWPVQQLMVSLGLHRQGVTVYLPVVLVLTFALAAASWFGLERWALRLKDTFGGSRGKVIPAQEPELQAVG